MDRKFVVGKQLEGRLGFGPLWEATAGASFSGTSLITIRPSSSSDCQDGVAGVGDWGQCIPRKLLVLSEPHNATNGSKPY